MARGVTTRRGSVLAGYIGQRFVTTLALALAAVFALIVIVSAIELTSRAGDRGVGVGAVLSMALAQAPAIALTAAPFTVLLASLGAFARMTRASEIVAMRAAGVSIWAIAGAPMLAAAGFGLAALAALNPIAAATTQRFEALESRYLEGRSEAFSISEEGLWLRQGDGAGGAVVIEAHGADATATRLSDVTFYRFDASGALVGRLDAARAVLGQGLWTVEDGRERDFLRGGPPIPRPQMTIPTELTGQHILESFAPPEQLSFWALPGFIATLEEAGFSAQRFRTHWHAQLAAPLLFAAMAAIGAGFATRHPRLGGLGMMALGAALSGFALFFLTDVAQALGGSGAIPAALAGWAPPGAAAAFAASLLLWRDER